MAIEEADTAQNRSGCWDDIVVWILYGIMVAFGVYLIFPFSTEHTMIDKRWKASVVQYEYQYTVIGHRQIGKYRLPSYGYRWVVVNEQYYVGPEGTEHEHPQVECHYDVHNPNAQGDTFCEALPAEYQVIIVKGTEVYYYSVPYEEWLQYRRGDELKVTWRRGEIIKVSAAE